MDNNNEQYLLSIDPANVKTAFCVIRLSDMRPVDKGKIENEAFWDMLPFLFKTYNITDIAIEYIQSFGMAVGATVFDTLFFIGRLWERIGSIKDEDARMEKVYRKDEKMAICGSTQAKDGNIRIALIDRFAEHDKKNGKGTKKEPDWFYGFAADMWQAYAVGIGYVTKYLGREVMYGTGNTTTTADRV